MADSRNPLADAAAARTECWQDEAECERAARALSVREGIRFACIELRGPLGAGKTTFVRHLLRALGVVGRVKSPSYAVVEPYALPARGGVDETPAWHFDFYRFNDPREWEDAGFRDLFATRGMKLCEWPDNATGLLPTPDLRIDLSPADDGSRSVVWRALTPAGRRLLGP